MGTLGIKTECDQHHIMFKQDVTDITLKTLDMGVIEVRRLGQQLNSDREGTRLLYLKTGESHDQFLGIRQSSWRTACLQ